MKACFIYFFICYLVGFSCLAQSHSTVFGHNPGEKPHLHINASHSVADSHNHSHSHSHLHNNAQHAHEHEQEQEQEPSTSYITLFEYLNSTSYYPINNTDHWTERYNVGAISAHYRPPVPPPDYLV